MTEVGQPETLYDRRIYAQDTQPADERDGVIWIDTSVSPRDKYVYSVDSASWESLTPQVTQSASAAYGYMPKALDGSNPNWWDDATGTYNATNVIAGGSVTTSVGTVDTFGSDMVDGFQYYLSTDGPNVTVDYVKAVCTGQNYRYMPTGGVAQDQWGTFNFPEDQLEAVEVKASNADTLDHNLLIKEIHPHYVALPAHTHNI